MQAFLIATGREISPFGPLSELRIHNQRLRDLQTELLESLGCRVRVVDSHEAVDAFPCLVIRDDLYFTRQAVRGFLQAIRRGEGAGQALRAVMPVSKLTEALTPGLQGDRLETAAGDVRAYEMYYLPRPAADWPPTAELARVPCRFKIKTSRAHPRFAEEGRFELPVSSVYMTPIRHWSNLVACNLIGMTAHLLLSMRRQWVATALLPLTAALRAGSVRPRWMQGKTYLQGRRCKVHPSAHVEGVVLGDRVRIEPNAVVRYCTIADGAVIGPAAYVEGSTIGPCATVNGAVQMRGSVLGAQASMGAMLNQLTLLGDRAILCPGSGVADFNLRGTVPVQIDGKRVDTGAGAPGAALGADAFVSPKVAVLGGTELPPGCVLVYNPRDCVYSVERDKLPPEVRRLDRSRRAA